MLHRPTLKLNGGLEDGAVRTRCNPVYV